VFRFTLLSEGPKGERVKSIHSSGVRVGDSEAERRANYAKAESIRRKAQNSINSARELGAFGPDISLTQLVDFYCAERQRLGVKSWKKERQYLVHYVLPELGTMKANEVRPRHLIDAYGRISGKTYEMGKLLSQKTLDNAHRTLRQVFEFAAVRDLIPVSENPCDAVSARYRKSNVKRDIRQRTSRSFSREEMALLIGHPEIPLYWRCLFGVEALAMTRASETARLRFSDWRPSLEPLGELFVDGQKTETPRWVPVHPHLAKLLAEWKLSGYAQAFGRNPEPGDFLFPYVWRPGSKKKHGEQVTARVTWKELQAWLARLGLLKDGQPRPQHGLRRAGSAAMADAGVSPHDRRCITHAPDLSDMQERYDAPSWKRLCQAISSIELPKPTEPKVLAMPVTAVQGSRGFIAPTPQLGSDFVRGSNQVSEITQENEWRWAESKGIQPAIVCTDESKKRDATVLTPSIWRTGELGRPPSRPIEQKFGPNETREAIQRAAELLENRRDLPAAAVRIQVLDALQRILNHTEGRLHFALEVSIDVLGAVKPGSTRETMTAKTLLAYALRELGGAP
jgi:integrase